MMAIFVLRLRGCLSNFSAIDIMYYLKYNIKMTNHNHQSLGHTDYPFLNPGLGDWVRTHTDFSSEPTYRGSDEEKVVSRREMLWGSMKDNVFDALQANRSVLDPVSMRLSAERRAQAHYSMATLAVESMPVAPPLPLPGSSATPLEIVPRTEGNPQARSREIARVMAMCVLAGSGYFYVQSVDTTDSTPRGNVYELHDEAFDRQLESSELYAIDRYDYRNSPDNIVESYSPGQKTLTLLSAQRLVELLSDSELTTEDGTTLTVQSDISNGQPLAGSIAYDASTQELSMHAVVPFDARTGQVISDMAAPMVINSVGIVVQLPENTMLNNLYTSLDTRTVLEALVEEGDQSKIVQVIGQFYDAEAATAVNKAAHAHVFRMADETSGGMSHPGASIEVGTWEKDYQKNVVEAERELSVPRANQLLGMTLEILETHL